MTLLNTLKTERLNGWHVVAAVGMAALGVFATEPSERGVKLVWPDPLPEDIREQATAAQIKTGLGVPRERVLAELGYGAGDGGVV